MAETDPIPLSALQHWAYCPRQCGLIHLEQAFADNIHTARGQAVHHLVDTPGYEIKSGVRVERALPLWSDRLGLIGKADLVEFHPDGSVYPVEFKHVAQRQKLHDDLQLAAQAMCLVDMLGRPVSKGAIFHASSHRRREVVITPELRARVIDTANAIRAMLASGVLAPPVNDSRCNCPGIARPHGRARIETSRSDSEEPWQALRALLHVPVGLAVANNADAGAGRFGKAVHINYT